VKQLKRGGRGHEPTGIGGTGPGELLVKCRCCPQPGYNLPNDWENAPPEKAYVHIFISPFSSLTRYSWLYTAHLAEDANFKQKARARPNDKNDESLQPGQGAFVNNNKFTNHLENAMKINPGEVSPYLSELIEV
jgi:hypothetical protein